MAAPRSDGGQRRSTAPPPPALTPLRLLGRAAARHCVVCGQGKVFRRWFTLAEKCPRCAFRFERVPGHFVGAVGMNTIMSFALLGIVLVAGIVITAPDVPFVPLLAVTLSVAGIAPIVLFPYSKMVWSAIDVMMRPIELGEVDPDFLPEGSPDPDRP